MKSVTKPVQTAHVDTFCADSLPPKAMWPVIDVSMIAGLDVERMNCATDLLDNAIDKDWGERIAYLHAGGNWTYQQLLESSNRIANVLVNHCGLVPGNRVLLRGYDH